MTMAIYYTHFGGDPYYNMAVDERLFEEALIRPGQIFLRLYTWGQGAITFGVNQKLEKAVQQDALGDTPLIRRVTGGRALYHDPSELTYALVVNTERLTNEKLTGSITKTSQAISVALTGFLKELGISSSCVKSSDKNKSSASFFHSAPCFESVSRYEIVSQGQKIVASAQRRIGSTLLQHGAIKLNGRVGHSALDGNKCIKACSPIPLCDKQFRQAAGLFGKTIGDELNLAIIPGALSDLEQKTVIDWAKKIKKNSIKRREIVKHYTAL